MDFTGQFLDPVGQGAGPVDMVDGAGEVQVSLKGASKNSLFFRGRL